MAPVNMEPHPPPAAFLEPDFPVLDMVNGLLWGRIGCIGRCNVEVVLNVRLIQADWLFLPAPHRSAGLIESIRKQETWRKGPAIVLVV
jgi:hypothetical protein